MKVYMSLLRVKEKKNTTLVFLLSNCRNTKTPL